MTSNAREGRDAAPVTRTRSARGGVQRIRLLIVDDHTLLRQALRALLEAQPNLEVIGEAINGRDAVEIAEQMMPDVVLMDMVMPGLNGIDATRQILKRSPGTRVLILTAYLEDERLLQAKQPDGKTGYDLLTNREREVLQLIAEGLSNQQIADVLVISVKTVEAHRSHIMTKLHAKHRTDLIRYAIRRGLIGLEMPDLDGGQAAAS